ncbi:kelch repeat and BTB domain-containing protein 2-like [Branchiostoma floridae]|uniref:Kelch repeat and BTB domain-containing protein 2-like n=1 Tax=Branchiostoma floridae TaxID=7739 RepID=A0A9J7LMT3_BRAFL|nr:kelch repeat and BTB domain-containing protein 2-like [Branchiostoma floridae]
MTNSEDDVVHAALRWIEVEKERLQNLPVLCSSFRHSFISREILTELESKRPSTDIKLVYSDSTAQRLGQTRTEMQIFVRRDWLEIASPYSAPCYDPSSSKLYKMNLPDRLSMTNVSMVATPDNELYLAGHIKSDRKLSFQEAMNDPQLQKAFYQYNHLLNAWESRCEMISPRKKCSLVCLKGYIYAVGGDARNTVELYNRSCDKWTSIAPLPHNMDSPCAVCLDDSIYVLSGKDCYCFSPTENTWNKVADTLGHPMDRQVVIYERRIYSLVRRYETEAFVQKYSPEEGTWTPSGNGMRFICDYAMLLVYDSILYLITVPVSDERYSTHWTLLQKRDWPPINLYKYQKSNDSWSKQDRKDSMVPPISRWMGAGSDTCAECVCLVAPMVPTALGDASSFQDNEEFMEGSSFQDNHLYLYGAELDMYGGEGENSSTGSFDHGIMLDELEDSTTDQETSDGEEDREVGNEDGDT